MKPSIQEKLRELLAFAKENGLAEIRWQEGAMTVAFRRSGSMAAPVPQAAPAAAAPAEPVNEIIKSPIVGTFRRAVTKGRPPLAVKGHSVKPGERLGVVECMKIPTEVLNFNEGVIEDVLVEEGQRVEYGQPLFVIRPSTGEAVGQR